ncbi:hypothetical protein S40288_05245 [Stachybotrys chartarum IBT 40288]|nr:hypothetical protein S40288_05245 [Stachybotrys chartarum IBT 40288]
MASLSLDPAAACQAFFALLSAFILALQVTPKDIREAYLNYGARRSKDQAVQQQQAAPRQDGVRDMLIGLTEYGNVPHGWFLHFYILSVSSSVFWAWQYLQQGTFMRSMAAAQARQEGPSMTLEQVYVAWAMMALQGSRRLYESLYVSKPGSSPMWSVFWIIGLGYYTAMNIAIWIEGSGAIIDSWDPIHAPTLNFLTARIVGGLALYTFACWQQNACHRYMASLRKYTLPSEGAFAYIVCPHYTYECLLYVAIAIATAPQGGYANRTVLTGLLFVATNLGATARNTKQWYGEKFGFDKVAGRWNMIPLVF